MRRMLLPMVVLAAALVVPTRAAAAEDCVCGSPTVIAPFGGWEALLESTDPRLLMDRVVDPAELETPDPHAVRGVAPSRDERAPQVLWCANGSDPRCAPLVPDEAPRRHAVPSAAPILPPQTLEMSVPTWGRFASPRLSERPSGTRDSGTQLTTRLERPPRA